MLKVGDKVEPIESYTFDYDGKVLVEGDVWIVENVSGEYTDIRLLVSADDSMPRSKVLVGVYQSRFRKVKGKQTIIIFER